MQQIIQEYAEYNLWAHRRLGSVLDSLSPAQLDLEIISSFPSLRETVLHIYDAELIWQRRLEGEVITSFPSRDEKNDDALEKWIRQSLNFLNLVSSLDAEELRSSFEFKRFNGRGFEMIGYQMIHHCMNHSSFHRGQIITILRQIGVDEIPSMDQITWYRDQSVL